MSSSRKLRRLEHANKEKGELKQEGEKRFKRKCTSMCFSMGMRIPEHTIQPWNVFSTVGYSFLFFCCSNCSNKCGFQSFWSELSSVTHV